MSNTTVHQFNENKDNCLRILNELKTFLYEGKNLNVKIDESLFDKIDSVLNVVENNKLKVALVGGFSEGKTSIAAAWMEKLDKTSMNISQQESSSEVAIYNVEDKLILIDTPGLFGFKEKFNVDSNEIQKYKDITKRYVSEADIVLYVMNSTNPVKESHKDDLYWLFRELNLLKRTVFVLSRFDEVADVEDEDDYQEVYSIKKQNIQNRLAQMLDLSFDEIQALLIVAVSANPFDEGIDYWLENIEEFKEISHIKLLQSATAEIIEKNGGQYAVVVETQKSIVADVLHKQLPIAIQESESLSSELERKSYALTNANDELVALQEKFVATQNSLSAFISEYFMSLLLQLQSTSMDTFGEFFTRNIGEDGIQLETKLNNEFRARLTPLSLSSESTFKSFTNEVSHMDLLLSKASATGVKKLATSGIINNQSVIAARDGLNSITKFVGLDFSKSLKFKPWGAGKFAKGANGALAILGLALEVNSMIQAKKKEQEFNEIKKEMKETLSGQQKELLNMINDPDFERNHFPQILEMTTLIGRMKDEVVQQRMSSVLLKNWKEQGEKIAANLSLIK